MAAGSMVVFVKWWIPRTRDFNIYHNVNLTCTMEAARDGGRERRKGEGG